MAGSTKGYRISAQDMEASRLVFVSVKGVKPKRKVAVPIAEGCTWEQFSGQVQQKLKLSSIGEFTLSQTGEKITSVDALQDIDELFVTEAPPVAAPSSAQQRAASGHGASTSAPVAHGGSAPALEISPQQPLMRNQAGTRQAGRSPHASDTGEQPLLDTQKYARRTGPLQRLAQRLLPQSLLSAPLPFTRQDVAASEGKGPPRRRKRRRRLFSLRNLLSLVALTAMLATLLLLYSRMTPHLT